MTTQTLPDSSSPSAKTAGFWDKIAQKYAASPVAKPEAFERKKAATRAVLRPTDVVLEIGCGTGTLALELAPLVASIDAVDISKEMIRIASEKKVHAGVENVQFHHSQIEALTQLETEHFDAVLAYNILHLVDDVDATLARVLAWLKPGGTLVASTPCLRESWVPYGLMIPVMRLVGKAPHVLNLSADDVIGAMERAGFCDIERKIMTPDAANVFVTARRP